MMCGCASGSAGIGALAAGVLLMPVYQHAAQRAAAKGVQAPCGWMLTPPASHPPQSLASVRHCCAATAPAAAAGAAAAAAAAAVSTASVDGFAAARTAAATAVRAATTTAVGVAAATVAAAAAANPSRAQFAHHSSPAAWAGMGAVGQLVAPMTLRSHAKDLVTAVQQHQAAKAALQAAQTVAVAAAAAAASS
jgi:hypothetical protein